MTYKRFEDLPVWQAGMVIAEKVFDFGNDKAFAYQGDLSSQLLRAALSICNNIAEGFERGSTNDLLKFLYIARGSAGEVRSMLLLMERLGRFSHLKSEISNLKSLSESVSRQLRAWDEQLQNSSIKGQRHLNDSIRQDEDRKKRLEAFDRELERIRQGGKPNWPVDDKEA